MTIYLSIIVFLPAAAGVLGLLLPKRLAAPVGVLGAVLTLAYSIVMLARFHSGQAGVQFVTDRNWIAELGIRYSLGVDGLNLFLILLTTVLWTAAVIATAMREWDRPRLLFLFMALGETAVLGAFMAQDLALFVVFFDLMLIPFYFLIGIWGGERRVYATTKLVIYTLVGSLLMLAGAVALGVLSTPEGGHISFSLATLAQHRLGSGSQYWIFLLFAAAFLVKAPAFPLHGWMPDAYREAPIPVILLFSAVVSKVGVYGFLRIVLPIMPQASVHYQELMLAFAVVSILYGSVLAFSQDEARLVIGYSSIAQLGFILLGIFSLDPKGAQGAVMQMVNHGLVVGPLFLIIGYLALRAHGSERLSDMGGMAVRAPVLAALFLIVALATLAMPGSSNFVGELLILFGTFQTKIVYGLVASGGVILAAVYMIRFYQRSMHNPPGANVESRDLALGRELSVLAPLVLVIVALGVYPNFILHRTERGTTSKLQATQAVQHREVSAIP
ncbi:MAG: complex I subunit 4 family protein [Thermoleophilaceae bacterium]